MYNLEDGKEVVTSMYDKDGVQAGAVTISRNGQALSVIADIGDKPFSLFLHGIEGINKVTTGEWTKEENGVKVQLKGSAVIKF
ncbi:hypothetical protein AB3U99_04850 [Niallia sp. JL1B1071]|uniref:hypothetical protein n=1 Tax=Niallia tiangongensis TaxID=3237105 RepID=UPI0037DCCA92